MMDNNKNSLPGRNRGSLYEIKVKGHLAQHWSEWMGNLEIINDKKGYACLSGLVPDQSALHGILVQIRNLGLDLISVKPLTDEDDDEGIDNGY